MAFRNPLTTLPASALTGQITGSQIAAGAIDGKTITGAILRAVRPDGSLAAIMADDVGDGLGGTRAYSVGQTTYAELVSGGLQFGAAGITPYEQTLILGSVSGAKMDITSGSLASTDNSAHIELAGGAASPIGGPYILLEADGNSPTLLYVDVDGMLLPRNVAYGTVSITAGSGATVTATVSGLNVQGSHFRGFVSTVSGAPSAVQATISNVTGTGATISLYRTGTATATNINYMIVGTPS